MGKGKRRRTGGNILLPMGKFDSLPLGRTNLVGRKRGRPRTRNPTRPETSHLRSARIRRGKEEGGGEGRFQRSIVYNQRNEKVTRKISLKSLPTLIRRRDWGEGICRREEEEGAPNNFRQILFLLLGWGKAKTV